MQYNKQNATMQSINYYLVVQTMQYSFVWSVRYTYIYKVTHGIQTDITKRSSFPFLASRLVNCSFVRVKLHLHCTDIIICVKPDSSKTRLLFLLQIICQTRQLYNIDFSFKVTTTKTKIEKHLCGDELK